MRAAAPAVMRRWRSSRSGSIVAKNSASCSSATSMPTEYDALLIHAWTLTWAIESLDLICERNGWVTNPSQSAGNTSIPAILVRGDHFFLDLLPTLGTRLFTAAFTFFCSAGVPYWATLARAFRACALSGIGYLRLPGRANSFLLNFLRCFVLRSFAMVHHYPPVQPVNPLMGG